MNAINKYKIRTDISKRVGPFTVYRIEALRDFSSIKKGELGGWIEKEANLSQRGTCWVYNEAAVFQDAMVADSAMIGGHANVYGYAHVLDNVIVTGHSRVYDNAFLENDVIITNYAIVCGNARISNNAQIYNNVEIFGRAHIYGHAHLYNNVQIFDNVKVHGSVDIFGNIKIGGNADIKTITDYYVGKNTWSSGRYFVYTRSNKKWCVGCFYGTSEELIKKAYKDSKLSGQEYERVVKYVEEMYKNIEEHNKHT